MKGPCRNTFNIWSKRHRTFGAKDTEHLEQNTQNIWSKRHRTFGAKDTEHLEQKTQNEDNQNKKSQHRKLKR
jgi:hypothetical protein